MTVEPRFTAVLVSTRQDQAFLISSISAVTESLLVAQLVQKRTALCVSSVFCQKLKE